MLLESPGELHAAGIALRAVHARRAPRRRRDDRASRASRSRCSPFPGTRLRTSRTTRTAASSPATSSSPARSGAPISPAPTGRRSLASIRMLVDTLPAETVVYPGPRADHDARRRARAEPVPRRAPRGARRREPGAEDRASARHARRHSLRAAAVAARHVGDRAAVRALRLPADHDARLRGHGALRADVRRGLRRRPEGDVHVRGPLGPLAHAAAGGAPRRSAARTSSTGCSASRSRRSSSRSRRCTATARPARAPPRALAGVRRGDRQRRPGDRRRADPALRRAARAARRHALPPRAQLDRLPRVPARVPGGASVLARGEPRPARRSDAREGGDEPAPRLRQLRRRSRTRFARRSTRRRRSASRSAPSASSASRVVRARPRRDRSRVPARPTLVRGLDYYSRTTWEFIGPLENENATLSGGGRYDYLVEEIGGPPTPGVGFGAGIERLLLAMEEEGVGDVEPPTIDVFFAVEPERRGERSPAGSPSFAGAGSPATPTTRAARSRAS